MHTVEYEYLVRAEQNNDLYEAAAFEQWMGRVGPLRASQERFGRKLLQQARQWLDRQEFSLPCNKALPACGLSASG